MLSLVEAENIVIDCIRQASGFSGPIKPQHKLKNVGIVDDDMREALNDEIVTNPKKGVRSKGHKLGPDQLTFTIETTVAGLRNEVFNKATPLP